MLQNMLLKSQKINLFIQLLIIVSVIQVSLETIPTFEQKYAYLWNFLEIFFITIFSIEYLLRIYLSERKIKFILSFYGLVDLISILPSIVFLGTFDLRFVRSLRLLRIVRVLKLARYSNALSRLETAFQNVKEELIIFLIISMILLYVTASGIYYFEHEAQPEIFKSIPHSLWWAIATLTTVGYGDAYPVTTGGKIFTFIILIIGLGVISIPSGLIASTFLKDKNTK